MPWIEFEYFINTENRSGTATAYTKNIKQYFSDLERQNPEVSINWYRVLPKKPKQ